MPETLKGRVSLADFQRDEDTFPDAALYAVSREGKVLHKAAIGKKGEFEIPDRVLEKAHRIYAGPDAEDFASVDTSRLASFRPRDFRELVLADGVLDIARRAWLRWLERRVCASGNVRHCFPYPWLVRELVLEAQPRLAIQAERNPEPSIPQAFLRAEEPRVASFDPGIFESLQLAHRCRTVCFGQVEVYRRVCCCRPILVHDPRIPGLLDGLQEWPEIPIPDDGDPPPLDELHFVVRGAIDERRRNAAQDLAALRRLSPQAQADYINVRPWLRCIGSCGRPVKVGQGAIHPDGTFNVCWNEPWILLAPFCHWEYAFVVKQVIDDEVVTIYDGLSANKWFRSRQDVELVSYHRRALACDDGGLEDDGTRHALLLRIGHRTDAHHLETPVPSGAESVQAPFGGFTEAQDWGLSVGYPYSASYANWGGTLGLYFFFSKGLRDLGIEKYRVRVVRANADGTPTGAPVTLDRPITWRRAQFGQSPPTEPFPLGPTGGLYTIPYWDDGPWIPGEFHAYLDTTDFANDRYMVLLDLFDGAGNRVTPDGGGGGGPQFVFKRWVSEAIRTDHAFDSMPYLFWWDNRRSTADIVDLRKNGLPSAEECQFIEGPGGTQISIGYRAFHPQERFQLHHNLSWYRGLSGTGGHFVLQNPNNVGVAGAEPSPPLSINHLLTHGGGMSSKCSFGLRLRTHVRTFDGTSTLNGLEGTDQGAFALENTSP